MKLCDFWGCVKLPKNNPIERLHNMFIKQILGLQKQTPTTGMLLELGQDPISFKASIANGMLYSFINIDVNKNTRSVKDLIFQRLKDQFHQNSLENIKNDTNKLRTYSDIKNPFPDLMPYIQ